MANQRAKYDRLLQYLQANILKGHGKNKVWCLFLQFTAPHSALLAAWIKQQIAPLVTSEKQHHLDNQHRKTLLATGTTPDDTLTACFFLSASGCAKLALAPSQMPADPRFRYGMKHYNVRRDLHDPPVHDWELRYQAPLDAMLLLAADTDEKLETAQSALMAGLASAATLLFVEKGQRLYFGNHPVEPFGFRDGISQPRLWHDNGLLDFDNAQQVVLVPENPTIQAYGSYLVYRKLEQDVPGFNGKIGELADRLQISRELAEAQVMGRFKDGTPLTLFENAGKTKENLSATEYQYLKKFDTYDPEFQDLHSDTYLGDYQDDALGLKCPWHAHIRKANPRLEQDINRTPYNSATPIKTRIVRRGIPYDEPGQGVGLLFMSYQKDIFNQFERIQRDWCNEQHYPSLATGLDPLIGQKKPGNTTEPAPPLWNTGWNDAQARRIPCSLSEVVHFKGGEYFYAPSLVFLNNL